MTDNDVLTFFPGWHVWFLDPPSHRSNVMFRTLILPGLLSISGLIHAADLDSALPSYRPAKGISGTLQSVGSDTLHTVMDLWAEAFTIRHPGASIQVEGKGSSTAPPALTSGKSQLGPMSRVMKPEEIAAFVAIHGYPPTAVRVAVDALAVFVHKDNPLKGLTLSQVDAVFSSTRRLGAPADITEWGQLGIKAWKGRPISLFGRNSDSGTYGFFKEHALGKGDFKPTVKEEPGSAGVVQSVGLDTLAIGYSGVGNLSSAVRAVPIGITPGAWVTATYEHCLSGEYPLARYLYIYIDKKPDRPLSALTREFLRFIHSKEGQQIVSHQGYYPLPKTVVDETQPLLAE